MKTHRGKTRGNQPVAQALPIMVLAASLLLHGCQPQYDARWRDVPQQPTDSAARPSTASPPDPGDPPRREGQPQRPAPVAPELAVQTGADGKSGEGLKVGKMEVVEGYGLAEMSAKAATGGESPSVFDDLFGDRPARQAARPADSTQQVSLVGLSLRDAVGLAIANHPDVSRGAAVVSQSAAEVSVAKGAWFPTMSYSVAPGYGTAYSRGAASGAQSTLGLSQLLYDFGKTPGRIEQADATLSRQRHVLNSTIEGVAYTAANHYVEFAAAQATLDAAREAIANLSKLRGLIAERVQASLSSASDLTQAEVAMQRAVVDQVQAQTRLNVAAANLAEIIGARPQSVADLNSVGQTMKALARGNGSGTIDNAPAVLAARAAVQEADAQVKIARADYYPAISLVANKSVMSGGGDNAYDSQWFGVGLSGTISAAGQNRHRVEAAQANRTAVRHQLASQRLSLRTALAAAETELAGAGTRLAAFDAMQGLSRTSRDLYWQEYTLGKRPLTQVLDAEHDIFSAKAGRIAATADSMAARLKAQTVVGSLVSGLRGLE
ncbi:MAG: TolC family protein [Proteobacteria bacterium]|nr:TolC family protein [Pseudomonadota bacterium]